MVSTCQPSDALSQHLSSYLGFSYLGHGVSDLGDIKAATIIQITEETVIEDIKEDIMSHQANNISKDRNYTKNQKDILVLKSVLLK